MSVKALAQQEVSSITDSIETKERTQVTDVTLEILIDKTTLDIENLVSLDIGASIHFDFPMARITFVDTQELIKKLLIKVGSSVTIKVIDNNNSSNVQQLSKLVVRKIHQIHTALNNATGPIMLECVHPFLIYQNFDSHCFGKTSASDIIQQLLYSSDAFTSGIIDNTYVEINETDGDMTYNRYKCCESEMDFIKNKILPFCTINDEPPYFFMDEFGRFYLTNFTNMYNSESSCIITNNTEYYESLRGSEKYSEKPIFLADNIEIDIGGTRNLLENIKTRVTTEDVTSNKVFEFRTFPRLSYKGIKGTIAYPIDLSYIAMRNDSTGQTIRNIPYIDAANLQWTNLRNFDDIIKLKVDLPFFIGMLNPVGSTIDIDLFSDGDDDVNFWLNGKYVVAKNSYITTDGAFDRIMTSLELIRPSLDFDSKTSIDSDIQKTLWTT